MRFKTDGDNLNDARMSVFSALQESGLSMSQAAKVLAQCHRHIQNRAMVEGMAKESGLQLDGFRTNEDLELYYDIAKDGHDVGFISKGWDDPGFRVGELLVLPADSLDAFRGRAPQIMDFCSTSGVVCTGRLTPEGLELSLLDNIYSEGFNIATFLQTLESVHNCAAKVRAIVSGE
jgi:hypothetical protein